VKETNSNYEKTYHSYTAPGGCLGPDFVHNRGGETGADHDNDHDFDDEEGGNANDYAGNYRSLFG